MADEGLAGHTPLTVTTIQDLESALAATRRTEIAMTWGALAPGLGAVAAPVRGPQNAVVAALELSIEDLRDVPRARACVLVAARALSRELAARPAALPAGAGADWRADPTSPAPVWEGPEATA